MAQPRRAEAAFLVLHDRPLSNPGASLDHEFARLGAPSRESLRLVSTHEVAEEANPALLAGLREGPARVLATNDLGERAHELDRARFVTSVVCQVEDPKDLSHLQAAWAYVRSLLERGGTLVHDLIGSRWFTADEVKAQSFAALDVEQEVRMVFDGDQTVKDPRFTEPGRVLNTRGMKKFARPDVVAVIQGNDVDLFARIVFELTRGMADGWMPGLPRQAVELEGGPTFFLHPEDSPTVQALMLHNDAVVIRTSEGEYPAFGKA